MADEPIERLGGLTTIEAAATPSMDELARRGRSGVLSTVPAGFHPGSEIANLTILGYDVAKAFEGRGSLEAASIGIPIEDGEMVMRCNLVCVTPEGILKNHSAGHISTAEADELIKTLQAELGSEDVHFHTGVAYRHVLKLRGGDKRILCTPPHDVPGTPIAEIMITADVDEAIPTAKRLNDLILASQRVLANHPINQRRIAEGKDTANSIWPWSPGYRPSMDTLKDTYGVERGVVISAVDLIRGIGVLAGLRPITVEGATGLYNTNYEGKAAAAIQALRDGADFVFLHVEASDEAGHEGDVDLKIRTIEYLDRRILKPVMEAVDQMDEPVAIALLPDHPTPCAIRTHTARPVPFTIYVRGMEPDAVDHFSEQAALKGGYGALVGQEFMKALFLL